MYNFITPFKTTINTREPLKRFASFYRSRKRIDKADPGIRRRKALLDGTASNLNDVDYDELESDFASLEMTHREHEHEINAMKEKEKFLIVKQKYFKEKFPNFLTWTDKQQIKYLHSKDPEEWTVDKLSEGFPALPETIKKIIKANWTKDSASKIENHDKSVSRNWNSFKTGQLELPPDMSVHLDKFSNRQHHTNLTDPIPKPKLNLPQGEFSHIITSYEKLKKNDRPMEEMGEFKIERKPLQEDYLSGKVTDVKQELTLDHYKKVLEKQSNLSDVDKQIVQHVRNEDMMVEPVEEVKLDVVKYVNGSGQMSTFNSKADYNHLMYPEKILIPKKKIKRGCTYKLNDCYYDDDGMFLYRVPGME